MEHAAPALCLRPCRLLCAVMFIGSGFAPSLEPASMCLTLTHGHELAWQQGSIAGKPLLLFCIPDLQVLRAGSTSPGLEAQ